jgi:hypothetical protein
MSTELAQKSTNKHIKAQTGTEKHKQAQKGTNTKNTTELLPDI